MSPKQLLAYFDRIAEAPGAVPRLRKFILDLAVRGKLVAQDERDEPAQALLAQLANEQSSKLSDREMARVRQLPPVQSEDLSFAIPRGWETARMGAIAAKLGAGSTPLGGKSVYLAEGVPFIRSQNVHNDGLRLDDVVYIGRATHDRMSGTHVRPRDLLLNITGASIGRCAIVGDAFVEGNVSQHVAIIRLLLPALRHFVHLALTTPSYQKLIDDVQVGVSREGLSMQRLRLFPMPIPPLAEQHRIVAKVDELMALCDRLEAAQAERGRRRAVVTRSAHSSLRAQNGTDRPLRLSMPALMSSVEQISPLRQTILRFAIQGRLGTAAASDAPAVDYLGARAMAVEAGLQPWTAPKGWAWSNLKLLGTSYGGGTPSKANSEFWLGKIPWVSPKDMKTDSIVDAEDHITDDAIENSAARLVPGGSLLMVVRGMILAHSFPTAINRVPVAINQDMKAVRPFRDDLAEFLLLVLKALKPEVLRLVKRSTHGTCKLLTNELFDLLLPIPPLAEQRRIVNRVVELMSRCDRLEAQLATTQVASTQLLEAVLHQALEQASHAGREEPAAQPVATH